MYSLASVDDRAAAMASHSIPLPILDDLGSRFIINIPDEERKDIIRIMFQVRRQLEHCTSTRTVAILTNETTHLLFSNLE